MIDSRQFEDLKDPFRSHAVAFFKEYTKRYGVKLLCTSTFRDKEEQDHLYQIGRTLPGKIITNAKAGESFHNYGYAFDAYPTIGGKVLWEVFDKNQVMLEPWKNYAALGKEFGFAWAGNWMGFKEYAHMQSGAVTLLQLKSGV